MLVYGTGNKVQGNLMGVAIDGTSPLGNSSYGIHVRLNGNTIGGTEAGAGNVIAYNRRGVDVVEQSGHAILGNSIFANTELGIDLAPAGVTTNDPGDADTGVNNRQNFPVLTAVTASSTAISGTLNSNATRTYRIEFFSNSVCDASGFGEGETFLGFTTTATDGSGNASFSVVLPANVAAGLFITATATDQPGNNTSEFSACALVSGSDADLAITKSDDADPVMEGLSVTYTLTVTNSGPGAAGNVIVTDELPAGAPFVSATPSQGVCQEMSGTVTCDIGSIRAGETSTIAIVLTAGPAGVITNNASTTSVTTDTDLSNNSASATTTVAGLCQPGTYWNGATCAAAFPGSFVSTAGATASTPCALEAYQDLAGQTSCKLASPGTFVGGYVNRCVNDIRRRPSQPLIQWRFHPHTVHRGRRLRSTQGPSDA